MKVYIIAISMILLLSFSFVFIVDSNLLLEQDSLLDNTVKDCANAAALYFDYSEFSEGDLHFLDDEGIKAVEAILKDKYTLSDTLMSSYKFMPNQFMYEINYFDDSMTYRKYENGTLVENNPFTYGYLFSDYRGYERVINSPTVIVYVNAGEPDVRLDMIRDIAVMESTSAYIYQED